LATQTPGRAVTDLRRRAIVLGSRGQDGRLLSGLLGGRGYHVVGIARGAVDGGLPGGPTAVELTDPAAVDRLVGEVQPDEVYHLAACHGSSEATASDAAALLRRSLEVNTLSLGYVLEAIRTRSPATRLFYAASSHVFGHPSSSPQDEATPLAPTSAYGISKAAAVMLCRAYRATHGVFAATGILYLHESGLRGPGFLSSRLVDGALAVRRGVQSEVVVGRLAAEADWGYAPEYVDAMHRILQLERADDFVVATGRRHSVRDFAAEVFAAVGLDWARHVREEPGLVPVHPPLVGDPRRLQHATGWRARVELPELARLLVRERGSGDGGGR
jgi:GDPmannose 4,6-dehydratase